jgi:hypothetical protein
MIFPHHKSDIRLPLDHIESNALSQSKHFSGSHHVEDLFFDKSPALCYTNPQPRDMGLTRGVAIYFHLLQDRFRDPSKRPRTHKGVHISDVSALDVRYSC